MMNGNKKYFAGRVTIHSCIQRKNQQGAVLLVAMIILFIVTLVGTSGITSITLEERMVSNMQSANKAFEGAEAALAQCEISVRSGESSELEVGQTFGVVNYGDTNIALNRTDKIFWQSNGMPLSATNLVQGSGNPEGLVEEPRCAIEYVGKVTALDSEELYKGVGSAVQVVYLNTGFSLGSDASTQSVVESVFVRQ